MHSTLLRSRLCSRPCGGHASVGTDSTLPRHHAAALGPAVSEHRPASRPADSAASGSSHAASLRSAACSSYSPLNEDELVALALAGELVLEVVHGPPALLLGEVGDELLKVARLGRLEDNDALLVVRDAVDDVGKLLARLQLLVLLETLLDLFVVIQSGR